MNRINASVPYSKSILDQVDFFRLDTSRKIDAKKRAAYGQFLTPAPVAQLMASLFVCDTPDIVLLDSGAGVGSLFCAVVEMLCEKPFPPRTIHIIAYECEPLFRAYLEQTMLLCQNICNQVGIDFTNTIIQADFIEQAVDYLTNPLFTESLPTITCAILNPPYRKITTDSLERKRLRRAGIETSNLYTSFLALAVKLLAPDGELVAITPRSFCNGPYFKPFRQFFLNTMSLQHIHLFNSREQTFSDDEVLQENIIFAAAKTTSTPSHVCITTSNGPDDELPTQHHIPYEQVIHPKDTELFIHLVPDSLGQHIAATYQLLQTSLDVLGIEVSTGRVIDFRAASFLRSQPADDTAPLIYPIHIVDNQVVWHQKQTKKPAGLLITNETRNLLIPSDYYVLVKRFTAKEERRRIVAAMYDPTKISDKVVGFENHLNYFHHNGCGLDDTLAKGLVAFLNSTLVDTYFRLFNGHTQVNATDLRTLKYPTQTQLLSLGIRIGSIPISQDELDTIIAQELAMTQQTSGFNPIQAKKRIEEAQDILRNLGMPRTQCNERSALTLLALLHLTPDTAWNEASNPLCGITPMMEFFTQHYGKQYKPNSRETVRRQTVHQFIEAGLVIENPDQPDRSINSPKTVYQIERSALALLRTYGSEQWERSLKGYLASVVTLKHRYAREREMQRISVTLPSGNIINLSPGGQNVLVEQIIHEFAPRFTPGGKVLYIGDADEKYTFFAEEQWQLLGITIDSHGKMPDVIIHHIAQNWLVLIEAVTSHGPIDAKRRSELEQMFATATIGLVFVTAFLTRQGMREYLSDISWETEVWVADAPSHLIHFDGERFLGSY